MDDPVVAVKAAKAVGSKYVRCDACPTGCDETRPQCDNCVKTKRCCPGYPLETDLIFRNESPGAKRRPRKTQRKSSSDSDTPSARTLPVTYEHVFDINEAPEPVKPPGSPVFAPTKDDYGNGSYKFLAYSDSTEDLHLGRQMTLNPTIEQQATTHFFKSFVVPSRNKGAPNGFLDVAEPLFQSAVEDSPLHLAIEAVAVSVVANEPGREGLSQHAAHIYGRALLATQRAMRDPVEATSDSTLLAILMFSMYESISSADHSLVAWERHIQGATAMVRARGVEQFGHPRSLLLFRAVRTQMLTNAIQRQRSVDEFPGPQGWLSDYEDDQSIIFQLTKASIQVPNFLAHAKEVLFSEHTPGPEASIDDLLNEAIEVQEELQRIELHMPAQWGYRSKVEPLVAVGTSRAEILDAWPGPMHVYKDLHIASVRNNFRVSQILCSTVIIDAVKHMKPINYTMDEKYASARTRIQNLVDDICSSVPFHLWGEDLAAQKQDKLAPSRSGAYLLTWPLFAASRVEEIPHVQRRWLSNKLLAIPRQLNLRRGSDSTSLSWD